MPLRKRAPLIPFATAVATAAALAIPTGASAASCTAQTVSSPLAKFGDTASYWLAPGGDFETGAPGWTLSNSAIVAGNETLGVLPGAKSLRMAGAGGLNLADATTPSFCVDPAHPTFRFLVKSTSPTATLVTNINFRASSGATLTVPAKLNTLNFGTWSLSQSQPLATAIPSLFLRDGSTTASITFKATTATLGSSIFIDDLLVDPYRRG